MTIAPKAYSYIRFSTPEQQTGDSFRRQYELSLAYAELHGLILDERLTYRDLGVSAFDKSNVRDGQLGAFLKAIESGAVPIGSYLLVESLDRISRAKITDALEIFMAIINRGVTLVTLADGMEYSKDKINKQFTDIIISIAIMSRAHEESLMKSKRIKEAWRSKRANLDTKKLTSLAPGWLEISEDRSRYIPVPHKVQLVQDIFDWTRNGMGTASVAKRLNQQNVPTFGARAKNMWHTSYIKKILSNRSVLGEFQPHVMLDGKRVPEGEPILDYFPRIISDEIFLLATSSQQSRRVGGAGRKGVGLSNLFSGLLRCGYCQGSMVYVNKGHVGPRGKLLVCSNAKGGKDCHYVPWEYTFFEKSMLTYCTGLDVEHFLQLDDAAASEITSLAERIALLKASVESIQSKESNILSAIESGAKFQQFEVRARQLEQERTHIEFELQSAQKKYERSASMKVDIAALRATIDDLVSRMNELTGDELYNLRAELSQQVKRLIGRIMIYPGGYVEKPVYIAALREHLLSKSYSPDDINEHISAKYNLVPNPGKRFFIAASRTGSIRMIQPSAENPEILHLETPDADVAANMRIHAESIGLLKQVLDNRMKAVQ
ncbi:recombinase family protein [Collimonas arenae]|uniref:Recombinase family protein n=1 Tax=Collimonas arenae TaxID=279058 RepID=A0A127PWM0_9BURK|nr:recombinase family protein [Collimonas arenae]AMP02124.1 recombinase family protein [Collimonas arenae]AMP12019.1 recombinase family protein [Collimonas arenae]